LGPGYLTGPLILKGTSFESDNTPHYHHCPIHHNQEHQNPQIALPKSPIAMQRLGAPRSVTSCIGPRPASPVPYIAAQSLTRAQPAVPVICLMLHIARIAMRTARIVMCTTRIVMCTARIAMHTARIMSAITRSLVLALRNCQNRCVSLAQPPCIVQYPSQPVLT
jgi:hypothetical protein